MAADLPAVVRDALQRYGASLAASGGWRAVARENLHVTLVFVGERPAEDVGAISSILERATPRLSPLTLGGLITLPPRRPRVAAVEINDSAGGLSALQGRLGEALAAEGLWQPERRRFRPHVTVARRTRGELGEFPEPTWPRHEFQADRVTLYRSVPAPGGSRYEPLASVRV